MTPKPDTSEIDDEIATLKRRASELDHLMKPSAEAPFDFSAMEALSIVQKKIGDAERRRARILAGDPVNDASTAAPRPAAASAATAPSQNPGSLSFIFDAKKRARLTKEFQAFDFDAAALDSMKARLQVLLSLHEPATAEFETSKESLAKDLGAENFVVTVTAAELAATAIRLGDLSTRAVILAYVAQRQIDNSAALEKRVAELEARPVGLVDRGVFKEDGSWYAVGDGVTWGGSYWFAQRATKTRPDVPDSGWRLAVKRGRDGKEART